MMKERTTLFKWIREVALISQLHTKENEAEGRGDETQTDVMHSMKEVRAFAEHYDVTYYKKWQQPQRNRFKYEVLGVVFKR